MMANALSATGLALPQINTMDEFSKGVNASQTSQVNSMNIDQAKQQQYMQGLNTIAAGAAYATDPKTGQVDPTKWNEVVDSVAKSGADVSAFKDKPQLAPMLLKLSLTTQQQISNAQTQAQIDMAIQKYGFDVQQFLHPLPVKVGPGDRMIDPRTAATVGTDPNAGGFYGTSTEQQALQLLANGDPSTYQYAQAYNVLSQPTITTVPDGHGGMMQMSVPRTLPQGTRPPTYKGQVQAAAPDASQPPAPAVGAPAAPLGGDFAVAPNQVPAPGQSQSLADQNAPTTSANGTTLTPIPGLKSPPNESTIKSGLLSGTLDQLAPKVLDNWSTLADPTQQGIAALSGLPIVGGAANLFQSDEYQQAVSNMAGAVQSIVFQLSGANTAPAEMANTLKSIMPVFGDKLGQLESKRQNFIAYIKNIADASQDPEKRALAQKIVDQFQAPSRDKGTKAPDNVVDWTDYLKGSVQ